MLKHVRLWLSSRKVKEVIALNLEPSCQKNNQLNSGTRLTSPMHCVCYIIHKSHFVIMRQLLKHLCLLRDTVQRRYQVAQTLWVIYGVPCEHLRDLVFYDGEDAQR